MSLISEELSLWEIAFRWADLDPPRLTSWLPLPLAVRDHFRNIMLAILQGELDCITLSLEKWHPKSDSPPDVHIRHYLDDVESCISDQSYSRRLLMHAILSRDDIAEWCERRGIAKPAFWFPVGWKPFPSEFVVELQDRRARFQHLGKLWMASQDDEERAELRKEMDEAQRDYEAFKSNGAATASSDLGKEGARPVQRVKISCQQIAQALWKEDPNITVPNMARRDEIKRLGGAASFTEEVVRDWLGDVAPETVPRKPGRPPKKPRGTK